MNPKILEDIRKRTPQGWYGYASPKGWDHIVERMHKLFLEIDPNYEVNQIKEKFGQLEFYCSLPYSATKDIQLWGNEVSRKTCQDCGQPGQGCRLGYTVATLCFECAHSSPRTPIWWSPNWIERLPTAPVAQPG